MSELPKAKITRKHRLSLIWIIPVVAGLIAGWLVYQNVRRMGPSITIRFADGKGIQAGRTMIRYRGVRVGQVRAIELNPDMQSITVDARLDRSAAGLAREGSEFWVVRADVSAGSLRGLETIMGGSYIQAQGGNGPEKKHFIGLEPGPAVTLEAGGLDFTLTWPQLGWLNPGAPIYYRGVEVGLVRDYSLGDHATNILIRARIHSRYAPLVRENSKFWNAGGIKADVGLFGVSVSAETLKSLLVGGIAFATPSPPGARVEGNVIFPLNEKAEHKWLKWSPDIALEPQTNNPEPPPAIDLDELAPKKETDPPGL